jgi:hypothetical protein
MAVVRTFELSKAELNAQQLTLLLSEVTELNGPVACMIHNRVTISRWPGIIEMWEKKSIFL